eukprot:CAMPEP_0174330014 /NCGR_PEP_ID=MMETSP0810-20121108/16337_1 /TAXON_ID=73025 ORGANISM="Eutreptiella gymnastica-like, Strain CCMP1594" /NCGR_SAMPLE_ID=MMETSP0810 /ASSEMBLY_ACC=CAM_ASM_000659 /LENGTH=83 /DNA_ID=CAMNT_0015444925 /DNA_START=265 /DNA_END=517 /DNA_ORIENTATION=+
MQYRSWRATNVMEAIQNVGQDFLTSASAGPVTSPALKVQGLDQFMQDAGPILPARHIMTTIGHLYAICAAQDMLHGRGQVENP